MILKFDAYLIQEFFNIKALPYDEVAKKTFKLLLDNLETIDVKKFADYRRDVTVSNAENSNESRNVIAKNFVSKKDKKVVSDSNTSSSDNSKQSIGATKVSVMKNQSKHRLSSKIYGAIKQASYSLAINGKHFVSEERGKEGSPLVSKNISEGYWNLLTDVAKVQDDYKRRLINDDEFKSKIEDIRNKYTSWFSKLKKKK